eukprot:CAMPEP_0204915522 /NCGR_PEP_ID=MMETSP1397-20131031/13505_1 /ASSEMBLY_ACC=CAM_ASM_000891 /TAXON_ID=49980 /ORGANISM="Climacostomum Climacostomum virens, Strain Stock W-24" /LENGTH=47 /DNA_ID= /DNA_START= /DNA_END= /DNA_ORIENTATION=
MKASTHLRKVNWMKIKEAQSQTLNIGVCLNNMKSNQNQALQMKERPL